MTSISNDDLYKQILEMSARIGLPASLFADEMHGTYGTATVGYPNVMTYSTPEPKKIYLGMYVYVEKWPEVGEYKRSKDVVCINPHCPFFLKEGFDYYNFGGICPHCKSPQGHKAIESIAPMSMYLLIHKPLGVKCFKMVEAKDKKVIVPYPEYAFELGGTIIEDNLTPLKGIIDALKRSEKVHDYWYVLCASLQRYEAKFQPGRGLVII